LRKLIINSLKREEKEMNSRSSSKRWKKDLSWVVMLLKKKRRYKRKSKESSNLNLKMKGKDKKICWRKTIEEKKNYWIKNRNTVPYKKRLMEIRKSLKS
jgi:hypothetical protein